MTSIALIPIGFIATCASIGYDQGKSLSAGLQGAVTGLLFIFLFILIAPLLFTREY
ncbi:MAG: hypothetical protein AAGG48_32030 [Planctomycetota bacterium]